MNRRESLSALALTGLGTSLLRNCDEIITPVLTSPNFKHSVCRWCYNSIPLEEFADRCKDIGMDSIELLTHDEWDVALNRGMTCAIGYASDISLDRGFNDPSLHAQLQADYLKVLPLAANKGITQLICFSGNRNGMDDATGLENCAVGLAPVIKEAEKLGITIVMELLNSKIDHKDYQCDHTAWGKALVDKIGSPQFKLLYDIYHMQIMEGDIIRTIRDNGQYFSHFHTGGVPGRNEIDNSQELYYPAIMTAINDSGYTGYVAQEFIPTMEDPIAALKQGIDICTV